MPSELTTKLFNCSYLDEISLSGLFLRSKVSIFQKRCACNYSTLKKLLGSAVVQPKVTNVEYSLLKQNEMKPLEDTSAKEIHNELMNLIDLTNSKNDFKEKLADRIFEIRVKELKYIFANVSYSRLNEMKDGYKVLDKYLTFIGE